MERNHESEKIEKIKWWEILFALLLPIPCMVYSAFVFWKRPYAKKLLLLSVVAFIIELVIAAFIPAVAIMVLASGVR